MSHWSDAIRAYIPKNDAEQAVKEQMLDVINCYGDLVLTRKCNLAHFTASSMIFNRQRTKVLMAYHNIYDSWAWTGGHSDGNSDFFSVACGEALEETSLTSVKPISKEICAINTIPVPGHYKNGKYIAPHLHLDVEFLLEADEGEAVKPKLDENAGVKWIEIADYKKEVREVDMYPIYDNLIQLGVTTANSN